MHRDKTLNSDQQLLPIGKTNDLLNVPARDSSWSRSSRIPRRLRRATAEWKREKNTGCQWWKAMFSPSFPPRCSPDYLRLFSLSKDEWVEHGGKGVVWSVSSTLENITISQKFCVIFLSCSAKIQSNGHPQLFEQCMVQVVLVWLVRTGYMGLLRPKGKSSPETIPAMYAIKMIKIHGHSCSKKKKKFGFNFPHLGLRHRCTCQSKIAPVFSERNRRL